MTYISLETCNAGNGHKGDQDAVDPEGPEAPDTLSITVVLLPLQSTIALVHLPLETTRKVCSLISWPPADSICVLGQRVVNTPRGCQLSVWIHRLDLT